MAPASETAGVSEWEEPAEQLYRRYYKLTVRALQRWGSSPEDAEDLAQDTFVWLLERGTGPWPKRRPRQWLLDTARRLRRRHLRKQEAFRRQVLGEVDEDWEGSEAPWPSEPEPDFEAPMLHATRLIPRFVVASLGDTVRALPPGSQRELSQLLREQLRELASRVGKERLRFQKGELWALSESPGVARLEPAREVLATAALYEPVTPPPKLLDAGQAAEATPFLRVEVLFATNRERLAKTPSPLRHFGGRRGTLTFGRCAVSIPRGHTIGELEAPSWLHLDLKWDPSKHVKLLSISSFSQDEWLQYLVQTTTPEAPEALLFVHGYNVGFRDAVRRTAQMKFDLKFPGPAIAFSWPSKAKLGLYTHDEQDAEWTIPDLAHVLSLIAAQDGIHRVHLIAHSMGTRCLTRSLGQLASPALRAKFEEIILAAPDIDADVFRREILPRLGHERSRITLYASSKDTALKASKKVHGYQRAGDSSPEILTAPNLDSIDASALPGDLLGHSYFAGSRSVLTDIHDLLTHRAPPPRRFALEPRTTAAGRTYWWFRP